MKTRTVVKFLGGSLVTAVMLLACSVGNSAQAKSPRVSPSPDEVVPGLVLVKLSPEGARQFTAGASVDEFFGPQTTTLNIRHADQALQEHSIMRYAPSNSRSMSVRPPTPDDGISRILMLRYNSSTNPREAASIVARSPFVEYAEAAPLRKECFIPNDAQIASQWHHAKIKSYAAWDIEKGDSNVVIAIVDNGVEYTHPDLAPNIWENPGEVGLDAQGNDKRSNGIDDDGDGYIDDWHGWDFAGSQKDDPQDNDPSGGNHGVHVAGIAAGRGNNGIGIAGVAYLCKIMVVKVAYDTDPGSLPFGFQGITYAGDRGAKIINCSWGGGGSSSVEQEIINYVTAKGSLVVCAAGNSQSDAPFYPATYNHVLNVTGSSQGDYLDGFYANWGPRVDVIAPGTSIFSTYNGQSYVSESGTSMASPCASGVAALVASHFPTLTPDQIAARVRVTSDPTDSLLYYTYQKKSGFGRVDAYRAVHDSDVKAVWIDSAWVSNDDNGDGQLEPGETATIRVRFKNMLDSTKNLTAVLVDTVYNQNGEGTWLQMLNPIAYLGKMATFEQKTTSETEFVVRVSPTAPQNAKLWFRVEFTDGGYHDYRSFSFVINPTYVTLNANDVTCTVNSRGDIAFNDFPTNAQGDGFKYKGSSNLLYEGALMLATDAQHVVDVARADAQGSQDTDFLMTQRVAFVVPAPTAGGQEVIGEFTDGKADASRKLGVSVRMHHYELTDSADRNYVLLSYTVKNTTTAPINNLFCGIYLDWDIGNAGDSNFVRYDDLGQIGWIRHLNSNDPVCGAALVSNQPTSFYALDNNQNSSNPPFVVNDGYTLEEKWLSLSSGIGRRNSVVGDVSNTIGGGPVTIAPGQTERFAFILSSGKDLASLQSATQAGRTYWNSLPGAASRPAVYFTALYETQTHDTTLVGAAHNIGPTSVTAAVNISGPDASDFKLVTNSAVPLSINQRDNITIRFAPLSPGFKSALLTINYGTSIDTFNVYGNALASGLSVDPNPLFFDTIPSGQGTQRSITLGNDEANPVMFSFAFSGKDAAEFAINVYTSPISVQNGGTTFPVTFIPTHDSSSFALLTFTPTIGNPFTVPLIGYVTPPLGVNESSPATPIIVTNYPEPFANKTRITLSGVSSARNISVYDVLGRLVVDLTPRMTSSGAEFDATLLPAGTYYAKVNVGSSVVLRPMNVVK